MINVSTPFCDNILFFIRTHTLTHIMNNMRTTTLYNTNYTYVLYKLNRNQQQKHKKQNKYSKLKKMYDLPCCSISFWICCSNYSLSLK